MTTTTQTDTTAAVKPQPTCLSLAKATLVFQSEYGMGHHVIHVRDLTIEVRPYAQYRQAIQCVFVPKGKRNKRGMWQTYEPSLVVLDGHVDVAPANLWETVTASGATVRRGRASAFSESWGNEADAAVAAAVAAGARVVGDYRGFKTL